MSDQPEPAGDEARIAAMLADTDTMVRNATSRWRIDRWKLGLFGLDAYGGAMVMLSFEDRRLLNAMKRAGAARRGVYPGEWILELRPRLRTQEAGPQAAACEAMADALNAAFGPRMSARCHCWWS